MGQILAIQRVKRADLKHSLSEILKCFLAEEGSPEQHIQLSAQQTCVSQSHLADPLEIVHELP